MMSVTSNPPIKIQSLVSAVFLGECFLFYFVFLLQRTPMEEAVERGNMDIVHNLRGDGISDVNI